MNRPHVTVRLPGRLLGALRHHAEANGLTLSEVIVHACVSHLSHSCPTAPAMAQTAVCHSCPTVVPQMSHMADEGAGGGVSQLSHSCPTDVPQQPHKIPPPITPPRGVSNNTPPPPPHALAENSEQTSAQKTRDDGPPGFLAWWRAYPPSARAARRRCLQVWRQRKLEPMAAELLEGLRRWLASDRWNREDGRFICAPLVWLNQDRWETHPDPIRAGPGTDENGCAVRPVVPTDETLRDCFPEAFTDSMN